jgi:hypothetical protein
MRREASAEASAITTSTTRKRRGAASSLGIVLLVVGLNFFFFELAAYLSAQLLRERNLLYSPPQTADYATYLQQRDPILGWPSKKMLAEAYDEEGTRRNPYYPIPNKPCVSLYGDSATYAEQVSDGEAWSALLSRELGCRVANYGVPGYGTDQSFLRFSLNQRDESPVVVLNHFSGDIRRNVNQLRNLLVPNAEVMLKPRFVLEERSLTLIPLPQIPSDAIQQLVSAPASVVEHEYFLPGRGRGVVEAKFPYLFAVGRLLLSDELGEKVGSYPAWAEFYDPAHPSHALDLTVAIVERFVAEVEARGKVPVVSVIPDPADLEFFMRRGKFPYAPLIARLQDEGVAVLDVGASLLEALNGRNPCELASTGQCSGSFNKRGQQMIAEAFLPAFAMTSDGDKGMQFDAAVLGTHARPAKSIRFRHAVASLPTIGE